MKWTKVHPEKSGFYWFKEPIKGFQDKHWHATIVRVTISADPEWPEAYYEHVGYEKHFPFQEGSLWCGPIEQPEYLSILRVH